MARSSRPGPGGGVAKIGDVARRAKVSPATVSRVLNGSGSVSADRVERVREAAAALGYTPSSAARALRQQRTRVWAAIVADIENPFFTAVVRGIEDAALAEGHRLVLGNSDEDLEKEAAYLDIAVAEQMAGVVIAVASARDSRLDALLERGIPVVAIDRRPRRHEDAVDSVLVDNEAGARQATTHLLEVGATRIACITGPARVSTAAERLSGYQRALRAHGVAVDADLVRRADFKEDGGYAATRTLLAGRRRPDALFVANNLMTLGALRAVDEAGLSVPEDLLLVGFDDAPWTTLVSPKLTVVAQPTHEIGRQAALLLATASADLPARHVVLPPTLLVRGSTQAR
jgi:LacI family transcriptional regulator